MRNDEEEGTERGRECPRTTDAVTRSRCAHSRKRCSVAAFSRVCTMYRRSVAGTRVPNKVHALTHHLTTRRQQQQRLPLLGPRLSVRRDTKSGGTSMSWVKGNGNSWNA